MNTAKFISDYSPDTILRITQTDDGDVVLKIKGPGEMRIATSGGKLHGESLVSVVTAFSHIINVLNGQKPTNLPNDTSIMKDAIEVLNFYRNCHYNDASGTDSFELANAINDILPTISKLYDPMG